MVTILKKRQIVALSLVLMIVVAGYVQYSYKKSGFSKADDDTGKLGEAVYVDNPDLLQDTGDKAASTKVGNEDELAQKETSEKHIVEKTENTVAASKEAENYFAQTKLDKEISRSKETDKLGSIAAEEGISQEIKDQAFTKMMAIIDNSDKEMRIEALIKKQGFSDVIAFFADDGSVDIIVKAPNLSSTQVVQIADIVTRHANIEIDMISVKSKY